MHILFVSEYFPPKVMGGGEINLFLLAKSLVKNRIKVSVLTSHFKGLKKYEKIEGIDVFRRLKSGNKVDNVLDSITRSLVFPKSVKEEMKRINKEIDLDIIHFIGSSIISSDICKKIKKRCFATIESYPAICPKGDLIYKGKQICSYECTFPIFLSCITHSNEIGKIKNRFYLRFNPLFWLYLYLYHIRLKRSLKNCNLIAISEFISELLKKRGLKSKIVPNIIEILNFHTDKNNKNDKKIKLLYLGSLTKYKGPDILLKAIKDLDCRLDIYGEGILKKELMKIIKENKLDAKIHPNVDYRHIPKIYADSDMIIFPSLWPEPFGRIPIEAMAAGKPVIATDSGAIKETVKNRGLLVKPGSIIDLKQAITLMIKDKKLRYRLAEKGREYAQNYSSDNIIKKLIKIYEEK
ncbi:MAG: glycosyltransferase family 4 protein [Nanoarchaeota archaeon]